MRGFSLVGSLAERDDVWRGPEMIGLSALLEYDPWRGGFQLMMRRSVGRRLAVHPCLSLVEDDDGACELLSEHPEGHGGFAFVGVDPDCLLPDLLELPYSDLTRGLQAHWHDGRFDISFCDPRETHRYEDVRPSLSIGLQEVRTTGDNEFRTRCGAYLARISVRTPRIATIACRLADFKG